MKKITALLFFAVSILMVTAQDSIVAPLICGTSSTEFNPENYRLPEGTTIRDVILKLPGVTIDSLDNIYVNGRLVPTETDILVNGKEFFNEGKRDTMSLEQLTHDMIERVKAYDMRFEQNNTPQDFQVK